MGGSFTCDNYKEKHIFNSFEYNKAKNIYQNVNQSNNHYKLSNKVNNFDSNILENNPERKAIDKRLSEFYNLDKKGNMNKYNNSSFLNGSNIFTYKKKNIEIIENEKNNSINNKLNDKKLKKKNNNNKDNIIVKKFREKKDGIKGKDNDDNYN